jgi:hypothetical protein
MALVMGSVVLMSWLLGLTFTARLEHIDQLEISWPLLLLAVPVMVMATAVIPQPLTLLPLLTLLLVMTAALRLLRRRNTGDVKQAVTMLLVGIPVVDSGLLAAMGHAAATGVCLALALLSWLYQQRVEAS